jgi:2-C-methyl-D-erythritol 4-phosphate cytidylyltransferase
LEPRRPVRKTLLETAPAWAIIPAGGSGQRFSKTQDKLLAELQGQPILIYTLRTLLAAPSIQGIILSASEANQSTYQTLVAEAFPDRHVVIVTGGPDRRASVLNGLLALPDNIDIVVIHDAARPLIQPQSIETAIAAVRQGAKGAIVGIPIHDTVKQIDSPSLEITGTLDRSRLWRAQTPQCFQTRLILQAHRQVPLETPVTDDAQLLELSGLGPTRMIPGEESNLKITSQQDLRLAELFLTSRASLSKPNLPAKPQ